MNECIAKLKLLFTSASGIFPFKLKILDFFLYFYSLLVLPNQIVNRKSYDEINTKKDEEYKMQKRIIISSLNNRSL